MQTRQEPPRGEPHQPPAQGPAGQPGQQASQGQVGQPDVEGPGGERVQRAGGGRPGQTGGQGSGGQAAGQASRGGVGRQAGQGQLEGRAGQYQTGQPDARGPVGGSAGRPMGGAGGLAPVGLDELLQTEVVTVDPDTPVSTVVAEMAEEDVGSVVIVEDEEPVGIVTDRAIALALETTPDVAEREVQELVDDEFVTGSTEMSAVDVLGRLSGAGVRRLPIVDEDGALAGIVTLDDVIVLLSEELADVADVVRTQSPRL